MWAHRRQAADPRGFGVSRSTRRTQFSLHTSRHGGTRHSPASPGERVSETALTPEIVGEEVVEYRGPRLTPQQKAVALQLVAGRKSKKICRRFDISKETLCKWQRQTLFQAEIARLQAGQEEFVLKMNEDLREISPIAIANVAEIISRPLPTFDIVSPEDGLMGKDVTQMIKTQLDASFKVLATQGVSPVSKQSIKATTTNLNVEAQFTDLAEKWERNRNGG